MVGSVLALADRATEAVDLALIEEDDENGLKELPTRVRELTDHQRLVCQHAVDTLNDMLDVSIYDVCISVECFCLHSLTYYCSLGETGG